MFGYVRINKAELKFKEYEAYRAVYCSLCRELGKRYSVFARAFLNYDLAFLALFSLSVSDSALNFKKGRCPFNPLKKCNFSAVSSAEISDAADATVIMSYYKLKDNLADKGFKKKAAALIILPFALLSVRRARKLNPEIFEIIETAVKNQKEIEKSNAKDESRSIIDLSADSSAKAISQLIARRIEDDSQKNAASRFGYNIGRWVYLIDALDDLKDDIKRGNFNPYCVCGNFNMPDLEKIRDKAKSDLIQTANQAILAYKQIEKKRFSAVLDNIVYDGLFSEISRVYHGRKINEEKPL